MGTEDMEEPRDAMGESRARSMQVDAPLCLTRNDDDPDVHKSYDEDLILQENLFA